MHPHLLPVFLIEAEFCLDALDQALERLRISTGDLPAWQKAVRAAHTIKGNAAMMGLVAITDSAFAAELHAEAGSVGGGQQPANDLAGCAAELRRLVDLLVAEASAARRMPASAGVNAFTDHS